MQKSITNNLVGDLLTVTVTVIMKEYLKSPTESIKEQEIFKSVSQSYKILEVVSKPDHSVGNYNRKGMKQKGVWIFRIDSEKKVQPTQTKSIQEKEIENENPQTRKTTSRPAAKKQQSRKPPPAKKPAPKKTSTKPSIRGRIKKISEDNKQ